MAYRIPIEFSEVIKQIGVHQKWSGNSILKVLRRVGRPAKEWVREQLSDVRALFGSFEVAVLLANSKDGWNTALKDRLGF